MRRFTCQVSDQVIDGATPSSLLEFRSMMSTKTDISGRFFEKTCDMWHLTHEMWHVTCDMWHGTPDRWWEVNILSKFQVPSSYGLGVKIFWRYFGKRVTQFINLSINNKGVCRTAPATPGPLITMEGQGYLSSWSYLVWPWISTTF